MGKQMVRCPRDERVARSSAMIHLLPVTPWIMAVFVCHVSMLPAAPPNSMTIREVDDPAAEPRAGVAADRAAKTHDHRAAEVGGDPAAGAVVGVAVDVAPV